MARIQIINRSRKKSGTIYLRFRLRDGRNVDLYHRSEIRADLSDLSKFNADGQPKSRCRVNSSLGRDIEKRIHLLHSVYEDSISKGIPLDSASLRMEILRRLHPQRSPERPGIRSEKQLLYRFGEMVNGNELITRQGKPISRGRREHYKVLYRLLDRFLTIVNLRDTTIDKVDRNFILMLHDFIMEEYKYARQEKWSDVYSGMKPHNVPKCPRGRNTVSMKMKMFQAFLRILDANDEIVKNPFNRFTDATHSAFFRQEYRKPFALTLEEVRRILSVSVPEWLRDTKDAFLLQCALGCRISDFRRMDMNYLKIDNEGIPYVFYKSLKTGTQTRTPLVRFAFDIIMKTGFNLPAIRNVYGRSGYNSRIRELLKYCGVTREVETGLEGNRIMTAPLYREASSKLARKTNVTLLSRVQINPAVGGLHAQGSEAVRHYYDQSLADLFLLMSRAFGEEPFYQC